MARIKLYLLLGVVVFAWPVRSFPAVPKVEGQQPSPPDNPRWKILVLIYPQTDFTFSDKDGKHHLGATMTDEEKHRTRVQARRFFEQDVPDLTAGNQRPIVTILVSKRTLTKLDAGYWPSPNITQPDIGPQFDSVVVIWKGSGTDKISGKPLTVVGAGGLAIAQGTRQTYCAIPVDCLASDHRNVFKHEWGHCILFYFDAAGLTPKPAVDNHINDKDKRYVHWPTGKPYVLQDETDENPIPNSIYNNQSGFTRDYYRGETATPDRPDRRLGITPEAWAAGGPVAKPVRKNSTSQSVSPVPPAPPK